MTLKELCILYKRDSDDIAKCCNWRSEFLKSNKGNFHFEELDEEELRNLRTYLLCDILAIYEYLAGLDNTETAEWFNRYSSVRCEKEQSDDYTVLLDNPLFTSDKAREIADKIYESSLKKSIEPFKSRGIAESEFDYTV